MLVFPNNPVTDQEYIAPTGVVYIYDANGYWRVKGTQIVSSFNGREGAVLPQNGDYNANQITETSNREFASPTEKDFWNEKVDSVFGRSGDVVAGGTDYANIYYGTGGSPAGQNRIFTQSDDPTNTTSVQVGDVWIQI